MTVTPEKIAEAREARRQALFKRWAEGARLTPTELEEIKDLIAPVEKPTPTAAADVPPLFTLAPVEENAQRRGREFAHAIVEGCPYEKTFATSKRTLVKWRAIGRAATPPEVPPLDEPWKVADWYRRHMERRVPPRLIDLEIAGAPLKPTAPPESAPTTTPPAPILEIPVAAPPPPAPGSNAINFSSVERLTFEESLSELQLMLAANQKLLRAAMEQGANESLVNQRRKNVEDTFDLIRRCEKDLEERKKRRGELIDIADVIADWSMLLNAVATQHARMADDVATQLAPLGFTHEQLTAIRSAILTVRDREADDLRRAKHWTTADVAPPPAPELAAA